MCLFISFVTDPENIELRLNELRINNIPQRYK